MSTSSRNTHLLFRYGQCLNDGCSKCKSKEIQEIPARKDFVCQECGKELREVQRPRSWWEKYGKVTSAAVAAVVVIGGGVTWLATSGSDSENPVQENVAASDSSVITSPDTTEIQPVEKHKKRQTNLRVIKLWKHLLRRVLLLRLFLNKQLLPKKLQLL